VRDRKLLVIDDDPSFGELMVEYFKNLDFDVRSALNLEDAINVFRTQKPSVVLLDFNMPMVTGEKFLPILQSMNPLIQVIVVTGCLHEEVEAKFKGLGYFWFFEKGNLSLEQMQVKVEEALKS
jgi:DNA-binding NtrC family response regulator